jgi:hypothetical protein
MDKQERIIRKIIRETIKEMNLFHGTAADFDKFDLAYLGSGWGEQAYGYGFYLSDSLEVAKDYAQGGYIYTVKVPDGRYLSYEGISRTEVNRIAMDFYKYYTEENEYGREAYAGHEREFWEEQCKYILDAENGGDIYGDLAHLFGSDKETSEFLYKEGYKGIKWVDKGNTNYVIFNPKDLKILKKDKI